MPKLPTTSYAVLGLLSIGPRSGYDTVRFAEASIAHFWTIAKSQVYKELARLEELGYVRGIDVHQERLPDKRTYEITRPGREELTRWLNDDLHEPDRMRSAFLVKVFFGHLIDHKRLKELIEAHGQQVEDYLDDFFRPTVAMLAGGSETTYMHATALLGMRISETISQWAKDVVANFSKKPVTSKRRTKR